MGILFLWLLSHRKNLNFALGLFNGKTFSINPPHLSQFAVEGMSLFLMKKLYWSSFVSSCLSRRWRLTFCPGGMLMTGKDSDGIDDDAKFRRNYEAINCDCSLHSNIRSLKPQKSQEFLESAGIPRQLQVDRVAQSRSHNS